MDNFLLKENEVMIFTDFNNTLVDFDNEYDMWVAPTYEKRMLSNSIAKKNLTLALSEFERKTGLTPVICIVTNASVNTFDINGHAGINNDLRMMFFNHLNHSDEVSERIFNTSCEKYFKYLLYKENDCFIKIDPLARNIESMFKPLPFQGEALRIKYIPQFKKKESVERMLSIVDPNREKSRFTIFAGDSIADDYPMKLAETKEGTCKIFIRPGRVHHFKPSIMHQFCLAKGDVFESVSPRTGRKLKCFDQNTVKFLTERDKKLLLNFSDGDNILLTKRNSRGLIDGIYQSIEIVRAVQNGTHQKQQFEL